MTTPNPPTHDVSVSLGSLYAMVQTDTSPEQFTLLTLKSKADSIFLASGEDLETYLASMQEQMRGFSSLSYGGWIPPVGTYFPFDSLNAPSCFQAACGQILPNASTAYRHLVKHLNQPENAGKLKTEAEWQALSAAASGTGVPFYVYDTQADTIRLPDTPRCFGQLLCIYVGGLLPERVGKRDWFAQNPLPEDWRALNGDLIVKASTTVPDLAQYLTLTSVGETISETEWQAMSAAASGRGGVPFYVYDTQADTIRLPDTRGDSVWHGEVGAWEADAMRKIEGDVGFTSHMGLLDNRYPDTPIGAFGYGRWGKTTWNVTSSNTGVIHTVNLAFDNAKVVPTDTTNHPRRIGMTHAVYVGIGA